jgi:hypothetical protein
MKRERKQLCVALAQAGFHTAWVINGSRTGRCRIPLHPSKQIFGGPAGPVCTKAEFGLTRHATARSDDLLRTARLGVIATDHPFDLTSRTASIVNEDNLALSHCAHRRLLLQRCGKYRTGGAHHDKRRNDDCRPDHWFYPSS